jgi:hypothetical protein
METIQERTSNMLTGMLNGTQTLRDGMIGLFSSLTQSVIKNLVDMAAQALITNTILKSIMGIGGSLLRRSHREYRHGHQQFWQQF